MNQTLTETLLFSPTPEDETILSRVEKYLADAIALTRWWKNAEMNHGFDEKFELERTLNRPASSYGFFGQAPVTDGTMPVMGNVQDMFYDQPKVLAQAGSDGARSMQQQLREFVMHYFMRVSSFRKPEAFVPEVRPKADLWLSNLSWCPEPRIAREGFGFSQIYYKTMTGEIGMFDDSFAIVDMRDIGTKYEWIVLKVKIFDFSFKLKPFGERGPDLVFGLDEDSYLVVNQAFIVNEENPEPGVLGRYGIGYGFIKNPTPGLLTYGPGEFDAAFELIQFNAHEDGTLNVHMVFVVNRPTDIASIKINPLQWTVRAANLLSLGAASSLFGPIESAMGWFSLGSLDPVATYIFLVNALTGGYATEQFCISKRQLEKTFLLQHFMQHYDTVIGSLLTWRQIRNWLDEREIPAWVISGRSS